MRAVIADDEELARSVLREYLAGHSGVEIVAECSNGFEAVKAVAEHKPDVLFLDIQMPKLDGFETLELIDRNVAVVFCTAFDEYAMRAFDAAAVDYLLKPFSHARLQTALDKLRQRIGQPRPLSQGEDLRLAARPIGEYLERIVVKDGTRVHVIPASKLDYAEAQDDYVALRSEGRTWLKQQTITSLEAALNPKRFLRMHRGYLVNVERITGLEPNTKDTWVAVLSDGTRIPVSRGGYSRFNALTSG
jgi:two-component system LytT family response regulator